MPKPSRSNRMRRGRVQKASRYVPEGFRIVRKGCSKVTEHAEGLPKGCRIVTIQETGIYIMPQYHILSVPLDIMDARRVHVAVQYQIQAEIEAMLALALYMRQRRRRRHRWWVRPWLTDDRRLQYGQYHTLMQELRNEDVASFKRYLRITPPMFDDLLQRLTPRIQRRDTRFRNALPAGLKLAITLRYMATGNSYSSLAYDFRVAVQSICDFVPEVCDAILHEYKDEVLAVPNTPDAWREVADQFERRWNMPHTVGALDGKHVAIRKPPGSGSLYHNYKGFFSIVLLALVDANYKFIWCDLGGMGFMSDCQIFNDSELKECMDDNSIGFPAPSPITNDDMDMPYFIVGDDAFPMKPNLLKPYRRHNLTHSQKIFNYRLSRARRIVENAFGILSARWQCLANTMLQRPDIVRRIVSACICIHNLIRTHYPALDRGQFDAEDNNHDLVPGAWRAENHFQDVEQAAGRGNIDTVAGKRQREHLRLYFVSNAGSVPWQDRMVE